MVGKLDLNSSIDLDVRFAYGKPLPREETMDVGHFHHISTKLDQNLDWSTSYLAWRDRGVTFLSLKGLGQPASLKEGLSHMNVRFDAIIKIQRIGERKCSILLH